MTALALHLAFDDRVGVARREEISYAFSSFCALWGIARADRPMHGATDLVYGSDAGPLGCSRGVADRPYRRDGLPFRHDADEHGRSDHLAELFTWLSGELETERATLDGVGRVTTTSTTPGRLGVDPTVPWASRHAAALASQLQVEVPMLPADPAPYDMERRHWLVASHDIDFLATSTRDRAARVLKNAAIAAVGSRSPSLVAHILANAATARARGDVVLGDVDTVLSMEAEHGIHSTWNVIALRGHRRDGNYELADTLETLRRVEDAGHEIGVHGSYQSSEIPGRLAEEYALLRDLGFRARGGRQHWLRYRDHRLFAELETAGAQHDSSAGFADTVGFRHGLATPFAPWDPRGRGAFSLIEIPLVIMDVALEQVRRRGWDPREQALEVLDASRDAGPGGVSVLWHDTVFAGTQVGPGIGELYAELIRGDDHWVTAGELVDAVSERFRAAGLPTGSALCDEPVSAGAARSAPGTGTATNRTS